MIRGIGGSFPENSVGTACLDSLKIVTPKGEATVHGRIEKLEELDSKAKREWGCKSMYGVGAGLAVSTVTLGVAGGLGLLAGGLLAGKQRDDVLCRDSRLQKGSGDRGQKRF